MAKGFDQRGQRVERQLNIVRVYQTATRPRLDEKQLEEAQALLASLPVTHVPEPSPLPAGSLMTLPHNDFFVGRAPDLLRMAAALKGGGSVGVGELIAATGLGGLGKTQLAVEFVHRYGRYFAGGVYWLSFGIPEEIPTQVAAYGGGMELRPDFAELKLEEQLALVLGAWQSEQPRLLVFDNCEEEALLRQWRPPMGGSRVLLTARRASWDPTLGVNAIALDVLRRTESIELLKRYSPELSPDDLELAGIAEQLGDLPLALHLAGSFLHRYRADVSPGEYLAQLREPRLLEHASLLGRRLSPSVSPTNHLQNVAQTFALSYEKLTPDDEVDLMAIALLARAACFAPGEPIPRELLLTTLVEPETLEQRLLRADALSRLVELGLLQESADSLRMHRLVAQFASASVADPNADTAVEEAVSGWAQTVTSEDDRLRLISVLPHLLHLTITALERAADPHAAELCTSLGQRLLDLGDLGGAKPYLERALAIREGVLGPDHPDTAASLDALGGLLRAQGELAAAKLLYERALAIREKVLGPEHADTATSLNNLALLLKDQGEPAAARSRLERALAIRGRKLGFDHPDTARTLNSLGLLLQNQGELNAARSFHERALAIREKVLGPDHPDTANSLNNLAVVLQGQGQQKAARPILERALAIRERVLGSEHPYTASSLSNLALLLLNLREMAAAQSLHERALSINERVLGPDHRITAQSYTNLATALYEQGQLDVAQRYYERALATMERVMGADHPQTANSLVNLANLLLARNQAQAAQHLFKRAETIWQRSSSASAPQASA